MAKKKIKITPLPIIKPDPAPMPRVTIPGMEAMMPKTGSPEIWRGKYGNLAAYVPKFGLDEEEKLVVLSEQQFKQMMAMMMAMGAGVGNDTDPSDEPGATSKQPIPELKSAKDRLAIQQLRSILKDNIKRRPLRNKSYGDIYHKNLYKIATSGKIFERRQHLNDKKYYLSLLVDCSGSMTKSIGRDENGEYLCRFQVAGLAAMMLVRDLQDLVDIQVTMFNREITPLKGFHEKKWPIEKIKGLGMAIQEEMTNKDNGADNYDMVALHYAASQLSKERDGERILVIMSDGAPQFTNEKLAGIHQSNQGMADLINKIEKNGIPVLSLGIASEMVKYYYKHYRVLKDVSRLYQELIVLVKKTIGFRNR